MTSKPSSTANGSIFNSLALSSDMTNIIAAPSLIPDALPAVTVPSFESWS